MKSLIQRLILFWNDFQKTKEEEFQLMQTQEQLALDKHIDKLNKNGKL